MDIPKFEDLTERVNLEGDKVKLDDLLNQPIVVTGALLTDSKYQNKGSGKCVKVQFYMADDKDETKKIFFSGSSVLYDQIKEMQSKFEEDNAPMLFKTTLRKIGNYYSFT